MGALGDPDALPPTVVHKHYVLKDVHASAFLGLSPSCVATEAASRRCWVWPLPQHLKPELPLERNQKQKTQRKCPLRQKEPQRRLERQT